MTIEGVRRAQAAAFVGALLTATVLLAAPRGTDGGPVVKGSKGIFAAAASCASTSDCDDANPCTDDVCNAQNTCVYTPTTNSGTTTCGLGVCEVTIQTCRDGELQVCTPLPPYGPTDSNCNQTDDDCDGVVNDDYVPTPITCGKGVCRATGFTICQDGHEIDDCTPGAPLDTVDVTCNGLDDDCDGPVDEDIVRQDTTCGIGVCQAFGNISCVEGQWVDTCVPRPPILPTDTNCNNIDSDCDGSIDEDYIPKPIVCGTGACRTSGLKICVVGHEIDDCTPLPPLSPTDLTCDGIDDDCDGAVDDDIVRQDTFCGVGVCSASGNISCINAVWVDTCVPRPPILPSDTNCNNIDSDCDGSIDEDYVPTPIQCGTGACRRSGMTICAAGHEIDDCTPGLPLSPTDLTCDGIDDDCDGAVDDDIVRQDTFCGVGVCSASGNISCINAVWVDTCVPRPPILPTDTNCNNIDSDCDGSVDEDYVPTPIQCGTGACRRSGMTICAAGHEIDDCTPGSPLSPTDLTCDGIDDDCDGAVDDDIVRQDTFCGVGICSASGNISCINGQWVDTCVPRPPILPSDTNCNNIDSDCDGAIDEDYVQTISVCGFAACRRTGVVTCQAGHEIDGCVPGLPLLETCNGIDDDCDGIIDNGGGAALCDDGNTCNGIETCGGEIGCRAGIPNADASLSIPDDLTASPGGTVVVPVQAQAASGTQVSLTLVFNPSILQPVSAATAYLTQQATIGLDLSVPGQVHVQLTSPAPLHGEGTIASVTFSVVGSVGQNTVVQLSEATIDGGAVSTCRDPGRVSVCSNVPVDVLNLQVARGILTTLAWSAGTSGDLYDIASGLLSTLKAQGSSVDAACLADRVTTNFATDQRALPPVGDGYYYMVRERSACGIGSYGAQSSGDPRTPAVSCP